MTHPAEILPHDPIGPGSAVYVGERIFCLPPDYTVEQVNRFYAFIADGQEPGVAYGRVWR